MEQYLTNCVLLQERKGNRNAAHELRDLFEAAPLASDAGCGNVCGQLVVSVKTKKPRFVDGYLKAVSGNRAVGFYAAIPSALLMYRLSCLFAGTISTEGWEGYKVVWQMTLKHKPSGKTITFGEWKGGALFWLPEHKHNQLDTEFKQDLIKLLTVLVSDTAPHPYDGTVAGSVA